MLGRHTLSRASPGCSRWCDLIGQMPHVEAARKGYSFLSPTGIVVADLRPQKERLRAEASKTVAETAGLTAWDRQGSEG